MCLTSHSFNKIIQANWDYHIDINYLAICFILGESHCPLRGLPPSFELSWESPLSMEVVLSCVRDLFVHLLKRVRLGLSGKKSSSDCLPKQECQTDLLYDKITKKLLIICWELLRWEHFVEKGSIHSLICGMLSRKGWWYLKGAAIVVAPCF
jgi:hypothetical protein